MADLLDFSPTEAIETPVENEFDPTPKAAQLRILAYDAFHGHLNVVAWLQKEFAELNRTPNISPVLELLAKPDSTRILPYVEVKYTAERQLQSVSFLPGGLDSTCSPNRIDVFTSAIN